MERKKAWIDLATFFAVVLVANLISFQLYFRLDFTEDKQYTLSRATRDVLEDLDGIITVKAYFSEGLPPNLLKIRRDFADLLIEYEDRSDAALVYEFINPNESDEAEREAQREGINPVLVNVRKRDKVEQIRGYMGAVLYQENNRETIPYVRPGSSMEYTLTTSIKKLIIQDKPRVAFLQGYGEAPLEHLSDLSNHLSVLYELIPFSLTDSVSLSVDRYKAVVWIAPKDTIDTPDFEKVNLYLQGGGNLFVAYNTLYGNMGTASLEKAPDIGLASWLGTLGIRLGREFITDASCSPVTVTQRQGPFLVNTQVEFPYFPIIKSFGEHPIVKGLESVFLPFASSVSLSRRDSTWQVDNLLLTSELTGAVAAPAPMNVQKEWTKDDFNVGVQPVALAIEGRIREGTDDPLSRLVLVSNGNFAVNGDPAQQGGRPQKLNPDNVNLAVNSIDWLADDTGLIDLRTKGVTSRPIKDLEEGQKKLLKWTNVLLPVFLVLAYAFLRRQRRLYWRRRWLES
ncbi:MAG: Gldg family protein [Cytophagales bacterium]|nr:Gldg family protein [Cytophagales bacterium]